MRAMLNPVLSAPISLLLAGSAQRQLLWFDSHICPLLMRPEAHDILQRHEAAACLTVLSLSLAYSSVSSVVNPAS